MKKIFFISGLIFATTVAAFASDASPKYVEKQGHYCYVPEDCFGSFIPAEGTAQANCRESYISPIMCAMLDLYNMHINPKYPDPTDPFEHPLIQGNTREHAREIALSLLLPKIRIMQSTTAFNRTGVVLRLFGLLRV